MGKKSKGGSQQVVQKNDPWEGVQPHLLGMYNSAANWYNSSAPTVAGINSSLGQGLAMMEARARAGSGALRGAHSTVNNIQSGAYTQNNPLFTGASLRGNDLANRKWLDQNRYATGEAERENWYANGNGINQNVMASGQMLAQNPFAQNSRINSNRTASGEFLGSNPYLRNMVEGATRSVKDDFMESIAPAMASQFSAAGRMGSGAHQGAFAGASSRLAERLGDISSNIYGQSYENERGRMASAEEAERQRQAMAYEAERGAQRSAFESEYGRKYGAYMGERATRANAYESEIARAANEYGAEKGAYRQAALDMPHLQLQAASLAPGLAAADYMDAEKMMQAGGVRRDIEQQQLDAPLQRLLGYNSILSGASPYASSTQNNSNKQPYNRLTGTIGGGLGGYALGSMMGMGPIGAVVGGLGGLFG